MEDDGCSDKEVLYEELKSLPTVVLLPGSGNPLCMLQCPAIGYTDDTWRRSVASVFSPIGRQITTKQGVHMYHAKTPNAKVQEVR